MTSPLLDPLAHNSWATKQLIAFCGEKLSPEQLQATSEGNYGSILSTLQHIVGAESRYRLRLAGEEVSWSTHPDDADLDELDGMHDDMTAFWEELARSEFDPDRRIDVPKPMFGDPFEVTAGMLVAQTLNHGNEHRAQIFTILTTLGIEPPELDGWAWGTATGRLVFKPAT